jgi:hypothetical protein
VASQRAFAACFDASLALIGAHEAEGEASDDGHVFGPVSGPIARRVVAELDIEQPVHALHPPMRTAPAIRSMSRGADDMK